MAQITEMDNNSGFESNFKDYNTTQSEKDIKTKFQIECETAISIEEAEAHLLSYVRSLPWKSNHTTMGCR